MNGPSLEGLLRRDRALVAAALVVITVMAWVYIIRLASSMDTAGPVGMAGMDMPAMGPALSPWSSADFLFMFAMWAVMMIGMMTPSVTPMVLIYARVARQSRLKGATFAATGWFVAGYLMAWIGFAFAATMAQWGLERAALLTPELAASGDTLGAAVLIMAGAYQFTPIKETCLSQCQAPLLFIQRHGGFRRDPGGTLALGLKHGLYCVGCCWVLMALLFVGGVMNLLWIAALAVLVLLEKVLAAGRTLSRIVGAGLITSGLLMLAA